MRYNIIVLFFLFLTLNLFAQEVSLTQEEKDYIKNNPEVTLGYTEKFQPLLIEQDNGKITGIVPDLYKIVASKTGLKFNYILEDWKQNLQNAADGKVDIIPMMAYDTAKKIGLLPTHKMYSLLFSVFNKKNKNFNINSIKDLKGLRVAYMQDIVILDNFLEKYNKDFTLIKVKTPFQGFNKVLNNQADVFIEFTINGNYQIKNNFLSQLKSVHIIEDIQFNTISAVNPNKPILHSIITKALDTITYEEKLNITEQWTLKTNYSKKIDNILTFNEKKYLDTLQTLRVSVEKDWIPYNFIENGEAKGFSNDYMRLIGETLEKKIDFVQGYSWQNSLEMLKNKQIDIIGNIVITNDRKKDFIFSNHSTFATFKSLFSNKKKIYTSLEELTNKNVGVIEGYYEEELLSKHYPTIIIKKYSTNKKLISELLNGTVDAIIANSTVLNYILEDSYITSIYSTRLVNDTFPLKGVKMAFHKDNQILKSIFDKAISMIPKDKIDELKNKWSLSLNSQNLLTKEEEKYLRNHKFTLYYNENGWIPFIFDESDIPKGISVDIWSELTKNTNIQVTYKAVGSFEKILDLVKKNANTIVGATSQIKEREEYASFTKPYASFPIAIATNVKENFLIDLKELEGKTVAVGRNYTAHKQLLKHYPKIKFVPVKNIQTALDMLANGKVYAAADILPVINYELNKYSFTNLKISGTSKFNFNVQIMVNKQNQKLVSILNKLIDNMDKTKKQEIVNKWIHSSSEKIDYTIAYWISIVALVLFVFILYRQKTLKEQNKKIEIEVKKATHKLEELNRTHEDTQHLAKIATIKKDIKTGQYWVSKEFFNIYEFNETDEITSEKLISAVIKEEQQNLIDFMKKNEKYKGTPLNIDTLIIRINVKSNNIKYLELYLSYEFDIHHEPLSRKVTVQDITEKIEAKQEKEKQDAILVQQSKLASMGEMIGAIAHQWRQPLNELSIRIQKLKYAYGKDKIDEEFIHEFIQKNKNTIDFMSKTIDDFRNFFRIDKEKRNFNVKDAIEEVISIQNAQLKNHHIHIELNGESFKYTGYKTEFQQVIINLISNSKDALVTNKIIEPKIIINLKKDIIEFKDNGGGIDEKILKRVFEPYFTTKEQGDGTGMGLYMSKMIIEDNMNGTIKMQNTKDGVVISIHLKEDKTL